MIEKILHIEKNPTKTSLVCSEFKFLPLFKFGNNISSAWTNTKLLEWTCLFLKNGNFIINWENIKSKGIQKYKFSNSFVN